LRSKVVAVCPPTEYRRRPRLFRGLEQALPVQFEGRQPGDYRGIDAIMLLADGAAHEVPAGLPRFVATGTMSRELAGTVEMGSSPLVDKSLRGRALLDDRAGGVQGLPDDRGTVLASCEGTVLWARSDAVDRVALAPEELRSKDALRDALVPARWLSLLPLVHFLRDVAGEHRWIRPPTRAMFIVDDPNLHWWSYGFVDFRRLAEEARAEGYHVAMATIPLDAWLVHPGVARLFRERQGALSLLLHGNDHAREELGQPRTDVEASALLAQALRRVEALERRSRLRLSRLMVAPHNRCSEQMMRAMALTGFEGLCHAGGAPGSTERLLAGWEPADLLGGGLPVFPRRHIGSPRDDLVLRSFLGQPLIVYAHHGDFTDGPDLLAESAAFINHEPAVTWGSAESLARSSYLTKREGALLHVRLFARRVRLDLDEDVEQIVVELPGSHGEPEQERLKLAIGEHRSSSCFTAAKSDRLDARGPGTAEISLERVDRVDLEQIASPPRRVRPIMRRAATEGRDRLGPVAARLSQKPWAGAFRPPRAADDGTTPRAS
jgi:hypothetical protein